MHWTPRDYQQRIVDFITQRTAANVWAEMGLGKTSATLFALSHLFASGQINRVLIVAPRLVCTNVWPAEIAKWSVPIPVRYIAGTVTKREQLITQPYAGIDLITYGNLRWLCKLWRPSWPSLWDAVIYDEASNLKDPSTKRFQSLRARSGRFPRAVALTGSPAPESLLNVWGPVFCLDGGERLGRTFEAFKTRWFQRNPYTYQTMPLPGAVEDISARIADITVSLRATDYLQLPPLHVTDIEIDLPRSCRAQYEDLRAEMYLKLRTGHVDATNAAVLSGKCRQAVQGAIYLSDDHSAAYEVTHDEKLEALDGIVREARDPLLIVYAFRHDRDRLLQRYPYAIDFTTEFDPVALESRWNAGKVPMMLIHPRSAGHGLNLQGAGAAMVWFGLTPSWDQYDQCIARIAGGLRRERPTFVYRIRVRNTVEDDLIEALESKRALQEVLKRSV